MLRVIFILLIVITAGFIFLQGRILERSDDLPLFLITDGIANAHQTKINVSVKSMYPPNVVQVEALKKDYSNLWAHLNHLYTSNDVEAGKEYFTEGWFKQICSHYNSFAQHGLTRLDVSHNIIIHNWSTDGLICTLTDSVRLNYFFPGKVTKKTNANMAMVLLFQGDHWRIDALRIISETPSENP